MNYGLWVAKKNLLCSLIKKVSDHYGGDDIEELKEYCKDILGRYPDGRIDEAIMCFNDLAEKLTYVPRET